MYKFFAKSIVLMAIMTVSLSTSFGQNNNPATGDPEVNAIAPHYASITVTIDNKGANCPDHGRVDSEWRWSKGTSGHLTLPGSTAYYSGVPWVGEVHSIHPGYPYNKIEEAGVNAWPDGHPEAHNGAIVYPPFNPITLNPGPCSCYDCEEREGDPNNPTTD